MSRVLVSACLLGHKVRYDGRDAACLHPALAGWLAAGRLIALCPELMGGFATPRPPAEIVGPGGGAGVLDGSARVIERGGADVTDRYLAGAAAALQAARDGGARFAVLKAHSPSCASGRIHDGSFSGRLVAGDGVTAALLERHDIAVFNEHGLDRLAAALAALDEAGSVAR